ncbi:MAG: FtsL-like putative cell division protein [Bacteroidales bacterium]
MKENLSYNDQDELLNEPPAEETTPEIQDHETGVPGKSREPVKAVKKSNKSRKAVQDLLGGDYLSKEWVTGNLGFILYVGLLAMVFIANTYSTEKKFKMIERTKSELKELRYEYITTKSVLMFQGRQSEISKRAVSLGLKEAKMPPFKILYSGQTLQSNKP